MSYLFSKSLTKPCFIFIWLSIAIFVDIFEGSSPKTSFPIFLKKSRYAKTKDKDKKIISGDPEKVKKVYDTWKFSRDIRSENPNWFLIDTQA